jgi:hypothetical protein
MAQERLVLDEDRHGLFRIFWYLPDEDDLGACLGDYLLPRQPCEDAEHRLATESAKALNTGELDTVGLYWYTRSAASKALAAAKAALTIHRSAKPWPEWAKQALAAGWKAPKGWKP